MLRCRVFPLCECKEDCRVLSNTCKQHPKEVAGITDMRQLAEQIGDLHYEALVKFLDELAMKLNRDGIKDRNAGRTRLANTLFAASEKIDGANACINLALMISKKFMKS